MSWRNFETARSRRLSSTRNILTIFAASFSCAANAAQTPTASDLVTLAQSGASVYFRKWSCFESDAVAIRLEVAMFAAKFVPQSEVPTVMREFDIELERFGFGNPFTKRVCDKDAIIRSEKLHREFFESIK